MKLFILSLALTFSCFASDTPESYARVHQIENLIRIKDYPKAVSLSCQSIKIYPEAPSLKYAYIRALAYQGHERECLQAWDRWSDELTPSQKDELLEQISWRVIIKAKNASGVFTRVASLLAAAVTQDIESIELLQEGLQDPNALIRDLSIELATALKDTQLQKLLIKRLDEERNAKVRLHLVQSLAESSLPEVEKKLKRLLTNEHTSSEEKLMLAIALAQLRHNPEKQELLQFINSSSSGLRLLACECISQFDRTEEASLLIPLLKDSHTEVRIQALTTLGLLRMPLVEGSEAQTLVENCLKEPNYRVAITAAWLKMLNHQTIPLFSQWLTSPDQRVRHFAAAALVATGSYGSPLSQTFLHKSSDPIVRLNLAWGLLGQRQDEAKACEEICHFLSTPHASMVYSSVDHPLFNAFIPQSEIGTKELLIPELIDQTTSLKLIGILAIRSHPEALAMMKNFLKSNWQISSLASEMLIEQGEEEAVELIKAFLNDSDIQVRTHAALALAMLDGDTDALQVLQENYCRVNRDVKIKILEALGHIGDRSAIPFLISALKDPFAVTRVIAASSLILCLNH